MPEPTEQPPPGPGVVVYVTRWCGWCRRVKELLARHGVAFEEVDISDDPELRRRIVALSGRLTVPQVFVGGRPLGGHDDLAALEREGRLDEALSPRS